MSFNICERKRTELRFKLQKQMFIYLNTFENECTFYFNQLKIEDICLRQFDVETLLYTVTVINYLQYSKLYTIHKHKQKPDAIFLTTTTREQIAETSHQSPGFP